VAGWKKELTGVYNRGFETGFYFGDPGAEGISYDKSDNLSAVKKTRVGIVLKYLPKIKVILVKTQATIKLGDEIYIEGKTTYLKQKIKSMQIEKKDVEQVKKGEEVGIKVEKKAKAGDNIFTTTNIQIPT
ncbi:MAG: U32 family peptidase, partial [Patescibacteria group bacterium]